MSCDAGLLAHIPTTSKGKNYKKVKKCEILAPAHPSSPVGRCGPQRRRFEEGFTAKLGRSPRDAVKKGSWMTNRQGPLSTKVRANDQSHLQRGAPAYRRHLQGAVGILPTSFDSRAPPARSTLRAKSLAARVPIQNGYKSSPFFLSLDSYRLASCPDAARGADALKKDAEPRMNAAVKGMS